MPEEEYKEKTKPSERLVDVDTSGEGAEIEIKEEG